MSNGNGNVFWAADKEIVSSVSSPNSVIVDAPPKVTPEPPLQQNKEVVGKTATNSPKSIGNRRTPAASAKKPSWADEEEDATFLAQFAAQPEQSMVASLKTTIVAKEKCVKELEENLITKTLRIAELEGAVQERDAYVEDLENDIKNKNGEIKGLEEQNHDQYVEIQELHREVLEKDRHIERIKAAESEQVPTTLDVVSSISRTDSPALSDDKTHTEQEEAGIDNVITYTITSVTTSETAETPQAEASRPQTPAPTEFESSNETQKAKVTYSSFIDTQKAKDTSGPLASDGTSPVFVTRETLKEVPPVPKPKKLVFPIDLSRYGKKPATSSNVSPATKSVQSLSLSTGKNGHAVPWGQSAKQARVKTDMKPSFNPSADVRHMPYSERILYANGPDVTVKLGDIELKTLPQYILMQCSAKAMQYFTANPTATAWTLPEGSMDADAAKLLLNWMDEMTYQGRVYSITLNTLPAADERSLRVCRAARVMGLPNCYIGHFTKQMCNRIRGNEANYAFMDMVCKLAYPENDPVFDCLANNLVDQKASGNIADMAGLEKLVAEYPMLKTRIEKIEKRMRGARARK